MNKINTVFLVLFFLTTCITEANLPDAKNERLLFYAKQFLEKPYKAHTLEQGSTEELVINTNEFDCVTFVETALALTLSSYSQNDSFEDTLIALRYRNGTISGYESRLHYFAEWMLEKERNHIAQNISARYSKAKLRRSFSIMSSHKSQYKGIRNNEILDSIKQTEDYLSKMSFDYIPQDEIDRHAQFIPEGAIVAFVSKRSDVLIAHTAITIHKDGKLHIIHASSKAKKVVISQKTLSDYTTESKHLIGVIILELI